MKRSNLKKAGKAMVLAAVVLTLALGFAGCKGKDSNSAGETGGKEESGTVVIAGSTSVQPLSEELAEIFMDANENISIEVQGGGSGQGVKAVQEGIANFGALSREVKEEEKEFAATEYIIAKDGIAVIVNKETSVANLTVEQLKGIFTGEIDNWKDVGGKDEKVVVVAREEGSGTRSAFGELTKVVDKDASGEEKDSTVASALIQGSTGAVMQTVAATAGSVGYISLGSVDDTVAVLTVDGVDATTATVLDGSYKLSRPFIYIASEEPTGAAKTWIDFVMSAEGQSIVEEAGFISAN